MNQRDLYILFFFLQITITLIKADDFNKTCLTSLDCTTGGYICLPSTSNNFTETCGHCLITSQCTDVYGFESYCNRDFRCAHKVLWPPDPMDFVTVIVLLIGGSLAAGGGIGGGGVFVPVLVLIGGFTIKQAVPLSNSMIFGASIANYFQMIRKKHPNAKRPIINYDLALLMQPISLLGTVFGVILNRIFPTWLILVLLLATMIFTTYKTTRTGIFLYQKETRTLNFGIETAIVSISPKLKRFHSKEEIIVETPPKSEKEIKLEKILNYESTTPWLKVLVLFSILAMVCVHSLLVGGRGDSIVGIEFCSSSFWILWTSLIPLLIIITSVILIQIVKMNKKKIELHYPFIEGDVIWTACKASVVAVISLFAGILASVLGIGGGMVLSPVVLELGVNPVVCAATTSYMILFTSLSTIVQFAISGIIMWDYAGLYFFVGFISSIIGQFALGYLIKKYERRSYVVLCIVFILALSTILLGVSSIMTLVSEFNHGEGQVGFSNYCPIE